MTKLSKTLLFWTLILFACSPGISSSQTSPAPTSTSTSPSESDPEMTIEFPTNITTQVPLGPKIIVTVGTPNIGQGPDGNFPTSHPPTDQCAFSWANSPLDELSAVLESEVKSLNLTASARASAFGEDCIYSDGHKVFHAIETDFYIDLPVTDLTDFESFGNWISQTMSFINMLSPDMIEGPQSGFVEYSFTKNENEHLIVRVPIQGYADAANGKTGESLFLTFYKAP